MSRFRLWFEQDLKLRREQQQQVQKIYDNVVQALVGSAPDNAYTTPISDIQDRNTQPGQPPEKGARLVLKKLESTHIFDKLRQLQIPQLERQATQTQMWLQHIGDPERATGPKNSVGDLLNRLFGPNATEVYGQHKWQLSPKPDTSNTPTQPASPQATPPPPPDQQSPMSQQPPPMPQQMPGPLPLPGQLPGQMPGEQPDPSQPPMPPKPPGGLTFA